MAKLKLWLITFGVGAVLLCFLSVPLAMILYGGAGGVVGGAVILAPFMLVQYPLLLLFRRLFRSAGRSGGK